MYSHKANFILWAKYLKTFKVFMEEYCYMIENSVVLKNAPQSRRAASRRFFYYLSQPSNPIRFTIANRRDANL